MAAILAYGPALQEQFEAPKAAVVRVLGAGLLAAATAIAIAARRRSSAALRPNALDACVGAWLLVEIVSTLASVSPVISLLGDQSQSEGLLTSLGLAGLYAAARVSGADAAGTRRTLAVMLGAVAASCMVALWQLATFDRATWENAPTVGAWYRPFGSLGHANLLGAMTAASLAAAVGLAATRRTRRAWVWAGALLFGTVTVLTLSRAAWLAAIAGALVALAASLRPGRGATPAPMRPAVAAAWLGGGVILLVLLAQVGPLRTRALEMMAFGSGSGRARLEIWSTAVAMWSAHPWLGAGPDTFGLMFGRFQTPAYWLWEWGETPFHAHSIYLHALATRGLAGVAAGAAVAGAALLALRATWRPEAAGRDLAAPLLGLLVELAVAGGSGAIGIAAAAVAAWALGSLPGLAAPAPPGRGKAARAHPRSRIAPLVGVGAALIVLLPTATQLVASRAAFETERLAGTARAIPAARRAESLAPWSDVMAANAADVLRKSASRVPDPRVALMLAERSARRAVRAVPQRVFNQSELALVLLLQSRRGVAGADREAAATIARCMELGPWNTFPMMSFTEQALQIERPDLALPVARSAASAYPKEAVPRAALGRTLIALGDSAAGRAAIDSAMTLDWRGDRDARARAERARASLDAGRPGRFVLGVR